MTTRETLDQQEASLDVPRDLDLCALPAKESQFLFGPRLTGKTFLIHRTLPDALIYDLLDSPVFPTLSRNPGQPGEELTLTDRPVVIDEIQRLPELLNEVHRLIAPRSIRFLLTESRARKLRRASATAPQSR